MTVEQNDSQDEQRIEGAGVSYPKDTHLADMSDAEKAAYWKAQSRKHEARSKEKYNDYRQLQEKAKRLDELEAESASELEKAVKKARQEEREAVLAEANHKVAEAMLRTALKARGLPAEEIEDEVEGTNFARYVVDGDIDDEALIARADRLGKVGQRDLGQGGGDAAPKVSGRDRARAAFEARHGKA